MENNNGKERSAFIDFASFQSVRVTKRSSKGSVLKADAVDAGNARKIEVEANEPGQTGIILHRNGEIIESVEIVCVCGRHSEVRLEYDGD
jgi:hypothetical protein